MKRYLLIIITLIPLLLSAQSLKQNLEKPSKLYVGTPFNIHITLETAPEDSIFSPQYDSLDVFFLMKEPLQFDVIEDNVRKTDLTLTFQSFDTGEYTFPQLEFMVKTENDNKFLKTREFVVIVESVIADSSQVIKDIANPLKLKFSFWDYFIPAFALIFVIALIIFLKKLLKKPDESEIEEEVKDKRPAFVKALEMLAGINFEALWNNGNYIEYYYQLSIVLRYFIELHYKINALEMTTSEIRNNLSVEKSTEKGEILNLLREADRVKFAKYIPDSDAANELLRWLNAYLQAFANRTKEIDNA